MSPILQSWLDLVCQVLPRVSRGVLFQSGDKTSPITWPAGAPLPEELQAAAQLARNQSAPVFSGTVAEDAKFLVAYPLTINGVDFGVIALSLAASTEQQQVMTQLLDWSQAWLELLLKYRQQEASAQVDNGVLELLLTLLEIEDFDAATINLTSRLADHFNCERVSLGLASGDRISIASVSHQSRFDARVNLIGMMQAAMEESIKLRRVVSYAPGQEDSLAYFAHEILAKELGNHALCTLPLTYGSRDVGALLFERKAGAIFSAEEVIQLRQLGGALGPIVALQKRLQLSVLQRSLQAVTGWLRRVVGPGEMVAKLTSISVILIISILTFVEGDYEVTAPATLEGFMQQAIVAPFDGFIAASLARAGETVSEGQTVARMDNTELKLELQRVRGQREEWNRQYRQALATLNQAETRILKARLDQADARLSLFENRLRQVELRAPFAGIIISGDLSRSLGTAVEKGELLFEIAPLKEYRIVLLVEESDIDEISEGQKGQVVLTAQPGRKIPFVIQNISSVLDSNQASGVAFRTEGLVQGDFALLRPGMEGIARVTVGQRSLGWILFHDLADWIRLFTWRWLP